MRPRFAGAFCMSRPRGVPYAAGMRAKVKNGFPPKICVRCDRPFEWRKKWARDWENVQYCSERCKAGKA